MTNLKKYNEAFVESFGIDESELENLEYQAIAEWDSVGHMTLVAELEDRFEIEMDADDIIDFSSYEMGKKILAKYDIKF